MTEKEILEACREVYEDMSPREIKLAKDTAHVIMGFARDHGAKFDTEPETIIAIKGLGKVSLEQLEELVRSDKLRVEKGE